MNLALVRSGLFIRLLTEGSGRFICENGDVVSPPTAGYVNGNDAVLPVVKETVDTSTSDMTMQDTVIVVEPDRVVMLKTISNLPDDTMAQSVRNTRDDLLLSSDWVVVKAYEEGVAVAADWITYRTALRDVTDQVGFPHTVVWPVSP